ncbi:polysaccharide biosynthesis/export family protein [Polaribacter sp. IC073]|uniref:polysaccharide biosynthesis/export family protein n=1 Tax=Polaribacter sp. IC073 TaxID=2508540 RepID=UPI0011BFE198|nr:polysaccharide biosynthesis/export family protein [Polaribacter sp. IC073]TXD47766.1 polysaccharide export protein [Polaribacter sp. IC073]
MKKQYYKIFVTTGLFFFLTSCVSSKKVLYFQDNETPISKENFQIFEPSIGPDDLLTINIATIDTEAALPFNLYEGMQGAGSLKPLPYLVNKRGEIDFPVIGTIKVAGFTTDELSERIKTLLKDYLIKPTVNVKLVNFKVTVMGAVKKPGSYTISSERITIIEALGLAGDLELQGNRKTVLLVREKEGERIYVTIDLTNKKLFSSPYYYLAQNDVLYVAPNKVKINSSGVGSNTGVVISSISILITLVALLIK